MRLILLTTAVLLSAQEPPQVTFGTTVVSSAGLRGDIYLLKPDAEELPNFKRLKPVGSVYTTSLRIAQRAFTDGFPGVTGRFEWFAINYTGRFWIEREGQYRFRLLSDDGSKLWINGALVIDNDGVHGPQTIEGAAWLSRGVHNLRLAYFQGPGSLIALQFALAGPDNNANWRFFDTLDFQPPPDPATWTPGAIRRVKRGYP